LKKHEDKLHQLSNKLLETEVIFKEDLETIFGKRPFQKEEIEPKIKKPITKSSVKKASTTKKQSSKKSA
jgi:cell division protease FtsH